MWEHMATKEGLLDTRQAKDVLLIQRASKGQTQAHVELEAL